MEATWAAASQRKVAGLEGRVEESNSTLEQLRRDLQQEREKVRVENTENCVIV